MSQELNDDQIFLEIVAALVSLGHETGWILRGNDYEGIEWISDTAKPTPQQIDAERQKLADTFPWRTT